MGRTDMLHDALDDARLAEQEAGKLRTQAQRLRAALVEIERISREPQPPIDARALVGHIDSVALIGRIASNALSSGCVLQPSPPVPTPTPRVPLSVYFLVWGPAIALVAAGFIYDVTRCGS